MIEIPEAIIKRHETRRPTYKRVYWIVRDCLIEGRIKMNGEERLTEEALSEALNVSRTPVRTAMAQLKNEGFLQNVSKSRLGLSEFSEDEKASLVEVAMVIEGASAALAAKHATPQEIKMLRSINDSIRSFQAKNRDEAGLRGIRDLHASLHLLIGKMSHNNYLYKYVVETRNIMRMLSATNSIAEDTYPQVIAPMHDRLIDALERGDALAAQATIQSEILSARNLYLRGRTMMDESGAEETQSPEAAEDA